MKKTGAWLGALLALEIGMASAQATPEPGWREQSQADGAIYGWQLMTHEERDAHRARLRAAPTPAARERIRLEHHLAMQARACARGVRLPAAPRMQSGSQVVAPDCPGTGRGADTTK